MGNNILTILSFFYSLMLNIFFFTKKRIKNIETDIFRSIIVTNLINIIFAISSYQVEKVYGNPIINNILAKGVIVCFFTFSYLFNLYVIVLSKNIADDFKMIKNRKAIILYVVLLIPILLLPIHYFHEGNIIYSYGPCANYEYIVISVMMFYWFILFIKNFKNLRQKKSIPMVAFVILLVVVATIQKIRPELLLLTSLETFVMFLMYFTIENPDLKMLDEVHRAKEITDNSNEEKAMFLYNMTNELREITKDIDYDADNILNETDNKKIDREVINNSAREIKKSTARFTTMTNEILDVSQMDSANIKIYNDKYNLKLVIKELVQIYKKKAEKKAIEFRTNIDSDLPEYLYGDIIGLKTSLNVILDNSVKYTEKGYIDFSVSSIMKNDIARLIIAVEDSGTGMKAEELTKIFNKQESSKDSLNLSNNLNNAKKLITLMGGTIIPSSVYGKGTVMKVILDQKVAEYDGTLTKYESLYDKKKVLLVDDSEASIKIISKHIKDSNIILDVVTSGKECLDKIREKEKFDLILMDEEMEPLDGITVMKKLLDIRTFNIPVILLTKNNDYEYNEEYLKYGFKDYILKPTQKEDFFNKIDKYLK